MIASIQALRGIAAMMVVWHHAAHQIPAFATYLPAAWGAHGVDLFFVISGFIMATAVRSQKRGACEFMLLRIVRVVPLYWLVTLLVAGAAWVRPAWFKTIVLELSHLMQSLLFWPHFSPAVHDEIWPLLVPGWTLNYEMFFYGVFAACLALPARWQTTGCAALLVVLVGTGLLFKPSATATPWAPAIVYTSPMLLEFVFGMGIAAWHRHIPCWPVESKWIVCGIGAALLVIDHSFLYPLVADPSLARTLACGTGASLILAGVLARAHAPSELFAGIAVPGFARPFAWMERVGVMLGDASYSIYLTHLIMLGLIRMIWPHLFSLNGWAGAVSFMVLAMAACGAFGGLFWYFVERHLTSCLRGPVDRFFRPQAIRPLSGLRRSG